MSNQFKELFEECERKLKATQIKLMELSLNFNTNNEFFSEQLIDSNQIMADLKRQLKQANDKIGSLLAENATIKQRSMH